MLDELRTRLDSGEIRQKQPSGRALDYSLDNARKLAEGRVVWEEEDDCHPPMAQERAAVLEHYFRDIQITPVQSGASWSQIEGLSKLWKD